MIFMEADKAAAAGATDSPENKSAESAKSVDESAASPLDYKALLLALLSLPPEATDEEIKAKEVEVQNTIGAVPDLQTKASTAEDLQRQLDEINAKYTELNEQQQALYKQKMEAEADEILEQFADRITDEKAKARLRSILLSDREAGVEILNGLPKPAAPGDAAEKETDEPPAPVHDPGNTPAGPSDEEIAKKVSARAKELRSQFPKKSNAELFDQAEKEIRAELSTAASA
jgi:Fe2+ transport system protein B